MFGKYSRKSPLMFIGWNQVHIVVYSCPPSNSKSERNVNKIQEKNPLQLGTNMCFVQVLFSKEEMCWL